MAHFTWNENTPQGKALRELLDAVDLALHRSAGFNDMLNQMTNAQVSAMFGFSDGVNSPDATTAGNAKSELTSDLGKLLTDSSQTNVFAALKQMLAQFG